MPSMSARDFEEIKNKPVTFAVFDALTRKRIYTACYINYRAAVDEMIEQSKQGRVCQILGADYESAGVKLASLWRG